MLGDFFEPIKSGNTQNQSVGRWLCHVSGGCTCHPQRSHSLWGCSTYHLPQPPKRKPYAEQRGWQAHDSFTVCFKCTEYQYDWPRDNCQWYILQLCGRRQDLNRLRRHVTIITVPTFSNKSSKNKLVYLIMKWIDQMIKRNTNSDSPLNSQFRIKRHNIVCQSSTIDYVNVYWIP